MKAVQLQQDNRQKVAAHEKLYTFGTLQCGACRCQSNNALSEVIRILLKHEQLRLLADLKEKRAKAD